MRSRSRHHRGGTGRSPSGKPPGHERCGGYRRRKTHRALLPSPCHPLRRRSDAVLSGNMDWRPKSCDTPTLGKACCSWDGSGRMLVDWSRDQEPGPSGWHESYRFYQPGLEAELRRGLERFDHVHLREGSEVLEVSQNSEVSLYLADGTRLTADYMPSPVTVPSPRFDRSWELTWRTWDSRSGGWSST